MDSDHERQQRLLAAGTGSNPRDKRWTPPTPEALQGVFPNLQILELIGQGGMGAVYKARQTHLDRVVAVKLLAPHLTSQTAFTDRFQREAKLLARLSHPHIVSLYDVGEAGPWRYLVLEFVEGATLREVLTTGPFTAAAALTLTPQLCEALSYAHSQGIIHRDLKPENILIDVHGRGHIADFGLATLRGSTVSKSITQTGEVLGTDAYMAPEQRSGAGAIDHRVDLYALGVIVYEMLTGHLPLGRFEVPSYQGRLDVRIDSVVLQALERTPELRWQSAEDMRRAVDALAPRLDPVVSRTPSYQGIIVLSAAMLVLGALMGIFIPMLARGRAADASMSVATPPAGAVPISTVTALPVVPDQRPAPVSVQSLSPVSTTSVAVPAVPAPKAEVAASVQPNAPIEKAQSASAVAVPTIPSSLAPATAVTVSTQALPAMPLAAAAPVLPPETQAAVRLVSPPPAGTAVASSPPTSAAPPLEVPDLASHHLVVHGPGELVLIAKAGRTGLEDLVNDPAEGVSVSRSGTDHLVLNVTLAQAHARLEIPQSWLQTLSYDGTGQLAVRGCAGQHLTVEHAGTGTLDLQQLAVTELDLTDRSIFLTRLSGQVTDLMVRMAPGSGGIAASTTLANTGSATIGYTDAAHLVFSHLTAHVDGGACLRLQGHADLVVATVGTGFIDAAGLSVAKADITVTGSGQAVFGDLGAVDASCTGSGTVRWTGNPVLGHVIASP